MDFSEKYRFEERRSESSRILSKYPDRVPVICQRSRDASKICPIIDKQKYLIPTDLTLGQFIWVIRKRLSIPHETALFMFTNGIILPVSKLIKKVYDEYKNVDGFLYMYYNLENTFGNGCELTEVPSDTGIIQYRYNIICLI
jgi:GABA(A) receptor-associated protein